MAGAKVAQRHICLRFGAPNQQFATNIEKLSPASEILNGSSAALNRSLKRPVATTPLTQNPLSEIIKPLLSFLPVGQSPA